MSHSRAPFEATALRPFVSVTIHEIDAERGRLRQSSAIAEELSSKFSGLFAAFDITGKNPYKLSLLPEDKGVINAINYDRLSMTGVWFKRITAPPWLDANFGSERVQDTINHIILLAIRYPYLAVLGTHDKTRSLLSSGLEQGNCGNAQLRFIAPMVKSETLERAFVRGPTRFFSLSGLHATVDTKPDSKSLVGRDLRKALDPFSDQSFTYSSVVSILPKLECERTPVYGFRDTATKDGYAHYSFRVGVNPEEKRVWTVQTAEFDHLVEELHVLFDSLDLPNNRLVIGDWAYLQEGFKFLGRPIPGIELNNAFEAFDFGVDLPPPAEPGEGISVSSELIRCQELWRAHGRLEITGPKPSPGFCARLHFYGEPVLDFDVIPGINRDGTIQIVPCNYRPIPPHNQYHDGVTCLDTLCLQIPTPITIRYDSGHVVRGSRLFRLGWEDVLFEGWKWSFRPKHGACVYHADLEKPSSGITPKGIPDKTLPRGWEENLGVNIQTPASLFEYLVAFVNELFKPQSKDWYLCCDDGPGEVADFIYFEPPARRLHLIHVKAADSCKGSRGISVKAYEEVVSQATKNLRYLDLANLKLLIEKGKELPIAKACFHGDNLKPCGGRGDLLKALTANMGRRLLEKKVIVFQPHVRQTAWEDASRDWLNGAQPTSKNQMNRFLQLRTLLADTEITCRKIGAQFETWGEDDHLPPVTGTD